MATAVEFLAPEVSMRPMHAADVGAVAALERTAYVFPWSEGIFRDCLRVGYVCRVAVAGERVVAYGVMSFGAGEAHILNLCVDEAYRAQGLGRRMLEALLERARSAGMGDAFLEVRPSNAIALRLYRACGFEQVGVRRGYYQAVDGREDAAVLRLALTAPGSAAG